MSSESQSDTAQIIMEEKNENLEKTMKFITIGILIAVGIAVLSLIIAIVAIAKNGSSVYNITPSTGTVSDTDRVWLLQIGHYQSNTQYLEEVTGTIRGYNVDIVNAVCQIANKNCILTFDLYERCWDSQAGQRPRGGDGLMGGWYDACVGWSNTIDRSRTYDFTDEFEKATAPTYGVKAGGNFDAYPDFSGLKVGFLDGWSADEYCVARYDDVTGFDYTNTSQVFHFQTEQHLVDALVNDVIDVLFIPLIQSLADNPDVDLVLMPPTNKCVNWGVSLMYPKNQLELPSWWNPAFLKLKESSRYRDICNDLKIAHGNQPGLDPKDVCVD